MVCRHQGKPAVRNIIKGTSNSKRAKNNKETAAKNTKGANLSEGLGLEQQGTASAQKKHKETNNSKLAHSIKQTTADKQNASCNTQQRSKKQLTRKKHLKKGIVDETGNLVVVVIAAVA